ncbi:MAG TPA: FAD-dependent oxidoreductase [Candidatus Limnocylindria bacterium]|nr:FAD-dependent oxidoreductase [Candidatus Limnocylindria bacterium]
MASRPTIVTVDDDVPVLRAIERDLRTRYAKDYRILAAPSGAEALEAVRELTVRGDPVALFVVDQRMANMTGIEFLTEAIDLQPDARRVLLTAYADTDVAIRAINEIRLDQYLLKPWDPPEERLYPVLDDLLADWAAGYRPPFVGLRLIAGRWAAKGHEIRDYLTRNQVPYHWLDPTTDEEGRRVAVSAGVAETEIDPAVPIVVLEDGAVLHDPTVRQIAERVGIQTTAGLPFYDLVIVGGGPSGLAAAVYGASEGLKTVLVEREAPGGQAGTTSRIENYLGFPAGLSGGDLARRALAQARRLGAEILSPRDVTAIRSGDPYRYVTLDDGSEISCHAVIVASGVSYRQLEIPGAAELAGAGVYYGAAVTEAVLYRDLEVGVVGGGNSAGQAAVYLARFAKRVLLMVRTAELSSMSQYLIDQIAAVPNIEVRYRTRITACTGEGHLASATLKCESDEGEPTSETLPLSALFVFIGQQPRTEWLPEEVIRDEAGFIPTGPAVLVDGKRPPGWPDRDPFLLESSLPGVFAAGDVRAQSVKRIASAVGEGSMAIQFVHQYRATL